MWVKFLWFEKINLLNGIENSLALAGTGEFSSEEDDRRRRTTAHA
jgi:hypothetical protein